MIPIGTDYKLRTRPLVNYVIVIINVAVFVFIEKGGGQHGTQLVWQWLLHPDAPRIEQFFTSMFLHGTWMHLIGNMVFLWVFGNAVNDRLGQAGYLAFYLAGGVLAGLGYLLLSAHAPVLGASGAISAVTGAFLVLFPRTRVTVLFWFLYILTPIELSSLIFLLFQFVWNLIMSLEGSISGQSNGGVAYVAHSSGYVFGIAVAGLLLVTRVLPRDPFDLPNLIRAWHRRERFRRMVDRGYQPFGGVGERVRRQPDGSRHVRTRTVDSAASDTLGARELELRRQAADAHARGDMDAADRAYLQLVQISDDAVLSRQQQLDVANQLMAAEQHAPAADAYERFVRHYPRYEHIPDIHLMLGILYGRYLHEYDQAEHYLARAAESLTDERKIQLARNDLDAVRRKRGR